LETMIRLRDYSKKHGDGAMRAAIILAGHNGGTPHQQETLRNALGAATGGEEPVHVEPAPAPAPEPVKEEEPKEEEEAKKEEDNATDVGGTAIPVLKVPEVSIDDKKDEADDDEDDEDLDSTDEDEPEVKEEPKEESKAPETAAASTEGEKEDEGKDNQAEEGKTDEVQDEEVVEVKVDVPLTPEEEAALAKKKEKAERKRKRREKREKKQRQLQKLEALEREIAGDKFDLDQQHKRYEQLQASQYKKKGKKEVVLAFEPEPDMGMDLEEEDEGPKEPVKLPPNAPLQHRLAAFYALHNPGKLDSTMAHCKQVAHRIKQGAHTEEMLNAALKKKYGADLSCVVQEQQKM